MKGNNTLMFNGGTMNEAMEVYLRTQFKQAVTVRSVEQVGTNLPEFKINISETNEDE